MLVHMIDFRVAGVTFKNEDNKEIQEEFKRIVTEYKKAGEIDETELYGGYSNKEIKEDDLNVNELQDINFRGKLVEDTYQGELSYKVYIKDAKDNYIHIGYVPRRKVQEIKEYISNTNLAMKTKFEIVGGKYKRTDDDERVVTDEITYGTEVTMYFYNDEESPKKEAEKVEKDRTTAILLCIFLGWLGIHKFYENKILMRNIVLFYNGLIWNRYNSRFSDPHTET